MPVLSAVAVYNKSNRFGLQNDITLIEAALKDASAKAKKSGWTISRLQHKDIKEPPTKCDIQIHIEQPIYVNLPWARINILVVNPDHYYPQAYDEYAKKFDYIVCKDKVTCARMEAAAAPATVIHIPWTTSIDVAALHKYPQSADAGFVAFIGGSVNKCSALEELLPNWSRYPLTVFTTRPDFESKLRACTAAKDLVTIRCHDLDEGELLRLSRYYRGHVIVSDGEGFGHSAAKACAAGAFMIMNRLPVYEEMYSGLTNVSWIPCSDVSGSEVMLKMRLTDVPESLTAAFDAFECAAVAASEEGRAHHDRTHTAFTNGWISLVDRILSNNKCIKGGTPKLPPALLPDDCPPISIITITRNRRNFVDLCIYNLLASDYPHDKIEWVVVEDSDDDAKSGSDKFVTFAADHPKFKLVYVPVGYKMTIGAKRNLGVEQASNDICLFMDDDDYYPPTSFRRRVSWLCDGGGSATDVTTITTMAMYDLRDGRSAVNVPPWNLPLGARISEASLCFRKSFWSERKFSEDAVMAEGEEWLRGREGRVLEIPPQQIIVALSHGDNSSSRRIPPGTPVGCAWGWPEPLVRFLHGLVGVGVESV